MPITRLRVTLTVGLLSLACLMLEMRALSAAAADAGRVQQPSTRPVAAATQPQPTDPDVEKGRALARKDLAAGVVGQKLPIPEVFVLQWMHGEDAQATPLDYYQAILADRFGVRCEPVYIIPNYGEHDWKQADAYNEAMSDAIAHRCGSRDALHKLWVEACDAPTAKRAAYLKSRANAPPTTKPAGAKERGTKNPNANLNK